MSVNHYSELYFSNSEVDVYEDGFVFKRFNSKLFISFVSIKTIRLKILKCKMTTFLLVMIAFAFSSLAFIQKSYLFEAAVYALISLFFLVFAFLHPFKTRLLRIRSAAYTGAIKIKAVDLEDYKDALRVIVKILKTPDKKAKKNLMYMDL